MVLVIYPTSKTQLHVWEDGVREPELITTTANRVRELEPPGMETSRGLTLVSVIQKCLSRTALDRPSVYMVRKWLEKLFKVTLVIDRTKRCAILL
jgi:hypothetical protein